MAGFSPTPPPLDSMHDLVDARVHLVVVLVQTESSRGLLGVCPIGMRPLDACSD